MGTKIADVNTTRPSCSVESSERRKTTEKIDEAAVRSTFYYLGYKKTLAIFLAHSLCIGNVTMLFAAHLEIYQRDDLRRVFTFEFIPTILVLLCIPMVLHLYGIAILFDLFGKLSRKSESKSIIMRMFNETFGSDGVLGRRGPLYDSVLLCMAIIEFPIHTYQGYLVSNTIIYPGYALLYGSLIAIDSFMYPILLYVYQDIGKSPQINSAKAPITSTEVRLTTLKRRNAIMMLDLVQDLILAVIVPTFLIQDSIFQLGATGPWMSTPKLLSVEYSIATQVGIFSLQDAFVTIAPIVFAYMHFRTIVNNWIDIKIITNDIPGAIKIPSKLRNAPHFANTKVQLLGSILGLGYGIAVAYVAIYAVMSSNSGINCQDMLLPERFCYQQIASWDIFSNKCNCFHININCYGLEQNYTVSLNKKEEPVFLNMFSAADRGVLVNESLARDFNPRTVRIFEAHECETYVEPIALVEYQHLVVLNFVQYGVNINANLHLEEKLDLVSFTYHDRRANQVPEWLAKLPPNLASLEISTKRVEALPDWITEQWQNIYRLNVDNTRIKDASMLFQLKNLRYLTIEGGVLRDLPATIENKELRGLFLGDNLLSKIPIDQINQMPNLVNLALPKNNIESLDPWNAAYTSGIAQNKEIENLHVPVTYPEFLNFPPLSMLSLWENPICDDEEFAKSEACTPPCRTESICNYFNLRDVTCSSKCGFNDEVCPCLSEYAQEVIDGRLKTVLFAADDSVKNVKHNGGKRKNRFIGRSAEALSIVI